MTIVPTAGMRDQVTVVLRVPVTVAANVADLPAPTEAVEGPTVTPTTGGGGGAPTVGTSVIVEVQVAEESTTLVILRLTTCCFTIVAGAS